MLIDIEAGKLHEDLFEELENLVTPGQYLYKIVDYIESFLMIDGVTEIPGSHKITINTNNVVYHGLPGNRVLSSGDIITIDVCFKYKGAIVDGAKTFSVGERNVITDKIISVSKDSVKEVVDIIQAGVSVYDILKFLNDFILIRGFFLFRDGIGHGIGGELHQRPYLSLSDLSDSSYVLKPGDKFTIEPIVLLYDEEVCENIIGEGCVSGGNLSSQFEITIIIDELGKPVVINGALLK